MKSNHINKLNASTAVAAFMTIANTAIAAEIAGDDRYTTQMVQSDTPGAYIEILFSGPGVMAKLSMMPDDPLDTATIVGAVVVELTKKTDKIDGRLLEELVMLDFELDSISEMTQTTAGYALADIDQVFMSDTEISMTTFVQTVFASDVDRTHFSSEEPMISVDIAPNILPDLAHLFKDFFVVDVPMDDGATVVDGEMANAA